MTTPRRPNATDNSPIDRVEQFTFGIGLVLVAVAGFFI